MVPHVIFLLWLFQPFAQGCHYTNIRYENGTWCCDDIIQFDEGTGTPPPPPERTTTTPEGTVTSPIIPVGDCQCGRGVNMEEEARQHNKVDRVSNTDKERGEYLIRPWLAHIYIKKDSMQTMECSGSLLNRKWVITAAHCFCGTVRACPVEHQGFEKFWPPEDDGDVVKGKPNRKIKVQFGTKATAQEYRKWHKIEKIVIHPDYWQGPNEVAQPHDVALAMIEKEVMLQTEFDQNKLVTGLVPICLPPFMSVRPEDIGPSPSKAKAGPGDPFISPRFQMLNASARIPFEDMDCFMNNGPAPFPYRKIPDVDQGFLSCHPGAFTDPKALNIAGRTSYITAFGSTSREAGVNGDSALRYLCRTNAYGPKDSIFHDCHSKCTRVPNPSLSDPLCMRFSIEVASTGRLREDFNRDTRVAGLDDITPAKVILNTAEGKKIPCFPDHVGKSMENVRSGYDFPYKHGWCRVCERKGADSTQDCETLDSATLKPDANWGWCLPECDEDWMQSDWHNIARESMVDSFVYENCSHNVDTFSEFCTGAKLLTAYEMHYQTDGNTFSFIKGSLRTYRPEAYNNSLSSWEELPKNTKGEANENPWTQIRPGSKYQHLQHTQAVGDVCYGDAGGSVWKMWSFRDLLNKNKEDKEVRRPEHGKLAVLTGVISRFEHHCGFFRPDRFEHWSRPVQHSVHARVTSYLGWIMETIGSSGVCEPWTPPNANDDESPSADAIYEDEY